MNKVILIGRITKDIELKTMPNGDYVLANTIAVNRDYKTAQGETITDFINFVVFRKGAENISKYCQKGHLICLEGKWQCRSYDNKDGQRVRVDELVVESFEFLQPKKAEPQNNSYYEYTVPNNTKKESEPFADVRPKFNIDDEDLPF